MQKDSQASRTTLFVGLIQQSCTADKAGNMEKLAQGIARAAEQGAELVVLQELHNTLYFCQSEDTNLFDLAEPIPGPSTDFYGSLAKKYNIVLVTSLFERRAAGLYHNTAVVFERDGSIAGTYRKMHIPDDPAYYEKFYFTPGDLGFHPIQTSVGRLGVQVCWDQWYPEGARLMALQGAELLIYPTAIGYESSDTLQEQERQRSLHCRARGIGPVLPAGPVHPLVLPHRQLHRHNECHDRLLRGQLCPGWRLHRLYGYRPGPADLQSPSESAPDAGLHVHRRCRRHRTGSSGKLLHQR